jgi:hypothetical protein
MVYCIVEGRTDTVILSSIFENKCEIPKIIVSNGIPSMPAVARTILSFMEESDKVALVCDQDSFDETKYQKEMLGFLLRGAMNNPRFKLFVFDPNIDVLIPEEYKKKGWKQKTRELHDVVIENMDKIMKHTTVKELLDFVCSEPTMI